jgi:hypothetical protein
MSGELELRVVAYGSALEETPEGLYDADRIRRVGAVLRTELESLLTPAALRRLELAHVELDERILLGVERVVGD